jgi:predicted GTPase
MHRGPAQDRALLDLFKGGVAPDLFKVHIIKPANPPVGAGATTLMNAFASAADKQFRMGDEFVLCVVKRQGDKNIQIQVWDDNEAAKSLASYRGAEVELFLTDLSMDDGLAETERAIAQHTTLKPSQTIRMLVANKSDMVNEDAATNEELEAFASHYGLDGYVVTNANAVNEIKDLASDLTEAVMNKRSMFAEQIAFRKKLAGEIDQRIKELSSGRFMSNKATDAEKKLALIQLKTALLNQLEKPASEIITEIRTKQPILG